jgi:hypothetical protein
MRPWGDMQLQATPGKEQEAADGALSLCSEEPPFLLSRVTPASSSLPLLPVHSRLLLLSVTVQIYQTQALERVGIRFHRHAGELENALVYS